MRDLLLSLVLLVNTLRKGCSPYKEGIHTYPVGWCFRGWSFGLSVAHEPQVYISRKKIALFIHLMWRREDQSSGCARGSGQKTFRVNSLLLSLRSQELNSGGHSWWHFHPLSYIAGPDTCSYQCVRHASKCGKRKFYIFEPTFLLHNICPLQKWLPL